MKKAFFILISLFALSCSSDDKDCKEITRLSAEQVNGSWIYTIAINGQDPIITNKATVDFYKHNEAPKCFEGFK